MTKRALSEQAKAQRRQAILMAALEEFYLKGFSASRMEGVAQRVGISKGALYLYFSSKQALFEALIQLLARPSMTLLSETMQAASSVRKGIEQGLLLAPGLIRQSPLPKLIKVLISDAFAFPEVVAYYRENIIHPVLSALTNLLERGKATGEIHIHDTALTARLIMAPVFMSLMWTVVFETEQPASKLDVQALLDEHQRLLFRALGLATPEEQESNP